ncbi:hypothetical protein OSTOST_21267 [Ostertagia ostertagi]
MARDMEESNDPEAHGPSPIGTSAQVPEASPVRVNDVIPPLNRTHTLPSGRTGLNEPSQQNIPPSFHLRQFKDITCFTPGQKL